MDAIIVPDEGDWTSVTDPTNEISRWEQETGKKVPDDYRSFMRQYNGGRIYPLIFDVKIPASANAMQDPGTFVNAFYPWGFVEEIWNGGTFDKRNPPDMLVIGSDPGDIEILLSVDEATYGKVYLWQHSLSAWGADNNNKVWEQAGSFREFVKSFYENSDKEGYSYWYIPKYKGLEKKVEF
ncbi:MULTISPECIES: SMI1/KNR4 family protein [Rhizobium/Agrobacterium group]|uniref:SMI1 / KNR4 family protein n=1 Tax=Agrobacterium rosae TaxID=1972867 RepID=A0A1R3U1U5_9HYPH|nr:MULTISPECIES: SMI1/KNR4 family protein [Rhizobium/Agrobacterium group]SCX35155.1 SMI1 / KNR4 family protein [Agrobacterium rosae]